MKHILYVVVGLLFPVVVVLAIPVLIVLAMYEAGRDLVGRGDAVGHHRGG